MALDLHGLIIPALRVIPFGRTGSEIVVPIILVRVNRNTGPG